MTKRLIVSAIFVLLVCLSVTTASARLDDYATATAAIADNSMSKGDIIDMLRDVPPETIQFAGTEIQSISGSR